MSARRAPTVRYKRHAMARPLSLALAEHVVDWRRLAWPIPWSEVFGRSAPLALEIGFGNGSFLAEQAAAHPERDHIGIELSWTAATHLFRRLHRADLHNARVLLGEAEALVRHGFQPRSLGEVFVNHPCPWPKARHLERRLLERGFLRLLAERMRPGARLTVVTDHAEYAAWLGEELQAQTALASCHATVEVSALEGRSPTKYQLKAMAQGIPIHYFEWRRPPEADPKTNADDAHPAHAPSAGQDDPQRAKPTTEAPAMPTLTLAGKVAPPQLFRDFRPLVFRERHQELEIVVKFEAVYQRLDWPVWLLETLVQEGPLRQQFALDVVAREATLLLKPAAIGHPHPTHGVKRAVWCAARWLCSRHPSLTVMHESLGLAEPSEPWPPDPGPPEPGPPDPRANRGLNPA